MARTSTTSVGAQFWIESFQSICRNAALPSNRVATVVYMSTSSCFHSWITTACNLAHHPFIPHILSAGQLHASSKFVNLFIVLPASVMCSRYCIRCTWKIYLNCTITPYYTPTLGEVFFLSDSAEFQDMFCSMQIKSSVHYVWVV